MGILLQVFHDVELTRPVYHTSIPRSSHICTLNSKKNLSSLTFQTKNGISTNIWMKKLQYRRSAEVDTGEEKESVQEQ